jgi:hypothetical protein
LVVDNTNLTPVDRARYIGPALDAGFRVIGYFFQSKVADAIRRNADRTEPERVPDVAIAGASNRLQLPARAEGFDELFFVRLNGGNQFAVEPWNL